MKVETSQFDDFLQLVLDNVPAFIFWKDRDSEYLGCNLCYAQALGLTDPSQIIGKTDFEFYDEIDAHMYRQDDHFVITTGESKCRYREFCRMGKTGYWVETTKLPLRNHEGKIIGVLGLFRDVTADVKEQEQITTRLENQLDRITNGQ